MKHLHYWIFGLFVLFLFFFNLQNIPLWSSDEGRYGEIAREMWESKDFIVPQFNYVDYLEKPILAPLFTTLGFNLFGVNPLSARLIPVFSAIIGIVMVFLFSKRLFGKPAAEWTAVVLATMVGYVLVGRFAVIDMLMTFLLSLTMLCMMVAYFDGKKKLYLGAYLCMGLAFLTKGLIGILLPGGIFFVFLIIAKDFSEIRKMYLGWGILILAVTILPWCILISIREPEFFNVFIVQHHFGRFTGQTSFGRRKPFWFFIPILFVTSFPWSVFIPAAIRDALKKTVRKEWLKNIFLICWASVIFLFFSIPKAKLPYYILPVSVPIAMLIGTAISRWISKELEDVLSCKMVKVGNYVFMTILSLAILILNGYFLIAKMDEQFKVLKWEVHFGTAMLAVFCIAIFNLLKKDLRKQSMILLASSVYGLLLITILGMEQISPFQSCFQYAQLIQEKQKPGDLISVFASPDEFSDLPFHLRSRVALVGTDLGTLKGEIDEGRDTGEFKDWVFSTEDFVQIFNQKNRKVFCLLEEEKLPILIDRGIRDYFILKQGQGKVLLSNFA